MALVKTVYSGNKVIGLTEATSSDVKSSHSHSFTELTDTPSSYQASKFVKVNNAGNGLVFADVPGDMLKSTYDTNGDGIVNQADVATNASNADKLDNYHASSSPSPNTIPVSDGSGKLNQGWLPTVDNSDKLDGYHASSSPSPNTIPVSNSGGTLDSSWLPTVNNSDKVDNYHASQTPTPNTIPVSDSGGKLNSSWLPTVNNSDKVDDYHASQTPTAYTIPVAGSGGKLDIGWLPLTSSGISFIEFTSSTNWVVPSGVYNIIIYGVGGGGGGGGNFTGAPTSISACGGHAGASKMKLCTVSPGETLTITIGAGGAGGQGGNPPYPAGNGSATTVVGSVSGLVFTASGGYAALQAPMYASIDYKGQNGESCRDIGGAGGSAGSNGGNAPPNSGAGGGGAGGDLAGFARNGGNGGSGYLMIIY